MEAYERLLKYCAFETTSDENQETHPSTRSQFVLAEYLAEELRALGVCDVKVDEYCYVYGRIPASAGYEDRVPIGFIAHMDTSPDASGKDVKPQVIRDYSGEDLLLEGSGEWLRTERFAHLKGFKGRTLITTDGTTLLGADDKAGIAEIMTAFERILSSDAAHGPLYVAFTPDEEIGQGMDKFDLASFPAKYAYTVDGGAEGEIEFENFNAAAAKFLIHGVSVHPGDAKNLMVNAALVACEINRMLPEAETPAGTEEYEGFYHLIHISGDVNEAVVSYIIRDHKAETLEARLAALAHIAKRLNERYGAGTVTLEVKQSYRNMAEVIQPCYHLIENARKAIEEAGLVPVTNPIRGGTDGARLSFLGIPCPNLGTGGYAYHGCLEHITAEGMEFSTKVIENLVDIYKDHMENM